MKWNFPQTSRGSFSAVSTPIFASKYSLESSWRDLQDLHTYIYASLGEKNRIENEIMKMYTNKKYRTEKAEQNEGKLITYNTWK